MKSKLLTLEQVQARLSSTEPLTQKFISSDDKILFTFDPTWAIGIEDKDGTVPVDAVIRVNGTDYTLTKDAALQVGASFGLPGKYAVKLPNNLLEQHLNYWYSAGMEDEAFNMLATGGDQTVAAFTRPTINPFSNTLLVGEVVQGIIERYGSSDIYADYKFNHSLARTDVRFIIPEVIRTVTGGGMNDVPAGEVDEWAGGIHLTNSLIGKSQTKIEGYLFRWWCTNGATTTLDDRENVFSRRGEHEEQDVYTWAQNAVDSVLGGLEGQFDLVQGLTSLKLGANTGEVVEEIFDSYKVPVKQRKSVIETLEDPEYELNMYTVMNAITQTANDPDASDDRVDKLLRIGGAIPSAMFNSLKARIWDEGHYSSMDKNPYKLTLEA
jgi:hypothetical protein